jgi:hypothetical protein
MDLWWHYFRIASRFVKPPFIFTIPVGEAVIDADGHSLLGGPLLPGKPWRFEPSNEPSWFEETDRYDISLPGSTISIGTSGGFVRWIQYDCEIYRETGVRRMRKLRYLLDEHDAPEPLFELVDNGSAFLYASETGKQMAAYAYLTDILIVYDATLKRTHA